MAANPVSTVPLRKSIRDTGPASFGTARLAEGRLRLDQPIR